MNSSETRFDQLRDRPAAVSQFAAETSQFATPFTLKWIDEDYHEPRGWIMVNHMQSWLTHANVRVAVVENSSGAIGCARVTAGEGGTVLDHLEVDPFFRRTPKAKTELGLKRDVIVEGVDFSVGVGHVLVKMVIDAGHTPIHADVTPASAYVYKSLGFQSLGGSQLAMVYP